MNRRIPVSVVNASQLAERLGPGYHYERRTNEIFQIGCLRPLSEPELADAIKRLLVGGGAQLTIRHYPNSAVTCVIQARGSLVRDATASATTELGALFDVMMLITSTALWQRSRR